MYYQWGHKIGWSSTDPLTSSPASHSWDDNINASNENWAKSNDPSPKGWRVPTADEVLKLCEIIGSAEWITQNGVTGAKVTDKTNGASIFIPHACIRTSFDPIDSWRGSLWCDLGGIHTVYWSSTSWSQDNTRAVDFMFFPYTSREAGEIQYGLKSAAFPIRPVIDK